MLDPTYRSVMAATDRPLVWLHGAVKTPPFTQDAVVILAVFAKKTPATPKSILEACVARLKLYDLHSRGGGK